MKAMALLATCVALTSFVDVARAERSERAYFAGLLVRTDRSTQLTRFSGGIKSGRVALNVVLDPIGYDRAGQQSDTDVFVEVDVIRNWALIGGWRVVVSPVLGSWYWEHRPFAGISAPLPSLMWGRVRMRVAGEVSVPLVKHGDDLPTMTVIDSKETREVMTWSLFLRAELTGGF